MHPAIVVFLIFLVLMAFLTGWNTSVARHRARQRNLERSVADLELQADAMTESLQDDPQRAGIDIGKRYAVHQMQNTIDRLREEAR